MLLERIASEMNRLKFYMAHAEVNISSLSINLYFSAISCVIVLLPLLCELCILLMMLFQKVRLIN